MIELPIGESEGQRLEFKSAKALDRPEIVGKAVVAFLNASGGALWVGIAEDAERATNIEPLADPDDAVRRLRDHFMDTIDPPPAAGEVEIRRVGPVVRIDVAPNEARRPYAYVRGSARHFLTRVGARVRPMARAEIIRDDIGTPDRAREIEECLLGERKDTSDGLWVRIEPVVGMGIDLEDKEIEKMLMEPAATGNRAEGWNFVNPFRRPKLEIDRLVQWAHFRAEVRDTGGLALRVPVRHLGWREEDLYPLALVEYPVSLFRLAATLYRHVGAVPPAPVLADFGLFAVGGKLLRRGSPRREMFRFRDGQAPDVEDIVAPRMLDYTVGEIEESPDRCGARIARLIYRAFGYRDEDLPDEYDTARGRFSVD